MANSDLATRISSRLAAEILEGIVPPGSQIRTQHIADRYQVSRTPVRDALIDLEQRGVLIHHPNRGYFVSETVPESIAEDLVAQEDESYQKFAEDWLTDRLPETVTELALRQRYGLTKAGVNELLSRAAREGWAERREGYGWQLLPVAKTSEAFDQIYRFRMVIEPAAMLEPSFEVDPVRLAELKKIQQAVVDACANKLPIERLLVSGSTFHEELIRMSNNTFFSTALERVNKMRRLMEYRVHTNVDRHMVQCTEHLELVGLLEAGKIKAAADFMRQHLAGAIDKKSQKAREWYTKVRG